MAPYTPPPRDDDVIVWDSRRGVFLVGDKPVPRRRPAVSKAEWLMILAAINAWFWFVGLPWLCRNLAGLLS